MAQKFSPTQAQITQCSPYRVSGWISATEVKGTPDLAVVVNGMEVGSASVTYSDAQEKWAFNFRFDKPISGTFGASLSIVERSSDKVLPFRRSKVFGSRAGTLSRRQGRIEGWVDSITTSVVAGWAIDNEYPNNPIQLEIFLNGKPVPPQLRRSERGDLTQAGLGSGKLGFEFDLQDLNLEPGSYHVSVKAGGKTLPTASGISSDLVIPSRTNGVPIAAASPPATPSNGLLAGALDRANRDQISGWAIDAVAPGVPARVDIGVNGVVLKAAIAGMERSDIAKSYPTSNGIAGFMYHPPAGMTLSGKSTVSVRQSGTFQALQAAERTAKIGRAGVTLDHEGTTRRRHELMRSAEQLVRPAGPKSGSKVAAIILNRNGAHFLDALFKSINLYNTYENFELIVVDHGSTDRSRVVCRQWGEKLNIRFLARGKNYSYSSSNNWGAANTDADILFLLNNDVIFDSDLIREALPYLDGDVGMVGFKLASPPEQSRLVGGKTRDDLLDVGYELQQVQHLGIRFSTSATDRPFLPYEVAINRDNASFSGKPVEVAGVTAAALMIRRTDFAAIGGFHEEYFYGFEDVDLCLTLQAITGKKIICLNNIRAFHHRSASLERAGKADLERKASNRHTLERRVGRHIMETLRQERIDNTPFLREGLVRIAFAVSEISDETPAGDYFTALELARELAERHGYECVFLSREDWYELRDVDVIVAMVDGFRPSQIRAARPDIIVVGWFRNWFERWIRFPEINEFDAIWVSSNIAAEAFRKQFARNVDVVRIAAASDRMRDGIENQQLATDICFTGSYFGSPRQISEALDPEAYAPWKLGIFGHGWEAFDHLTDYLRGPQPYSSMPDIYASTKIVVDDANITTLAWGSVNSRVYDALASGVLVITNSRTASEDAFDGLLPVYDDRDDLTKKIRHFMSNPKERGALVDQLQKIVADQHSYAARADQVASLLTSLFRTRTVALRFGSARLRTSLSRPLEDLLRSDNLKVHDVTDDRGLATARRFGSDLTIHFCGIEGFELPQDWIRPEAVNIVLITCPADTIRPRDLSKYDLAITLNSEAEELCRGRGIQYFALPDPQLDREDSTAFAMNLKKHLQLHLGRHFPEILASAEQLLREKMEIEPSRGPSLVPDKQAENADQLRLAYILWDWPAMSQTFVLNELRWLVENGHDVRVYYKAEPDKEAALDFEIEAHQVQDAEELAVLLKAHNRTMIHTHFAYPAAPILAYPAAVITSLPFTITPAGVDIFHYDNIKRNRLKELTRSELCVAVFTLGSFHQQFFLEQGVPPEKIVIERQAVSNFPAVRSRKDNHIKDRPKIISFSRFVEKKGYRHFVEAAAEMPEADFILYGYGPQEGELRRLVAQLNLTNFNFGGPLSGVDEISRACADATIFALPCIRAENGDMDGLPTVLLEAMMLEVPVVSTNLVNIPDLVTDGVTGFLAEPGNVTNFITKLREACQMNPERRASMLKLARRKASQFGNTSRTMHTLMRVWQRKSVDIVLVTYDTGHYRNWVETKQILDRIYKHTTPPFNVFVVDNGSSTGFLRNIEEAFGHHINFNLIALEENRWCGPATNIGFAAGESDYIIYLCSKEGYVLRRGWERDMVRWMDTHQHVALGGHRVTVPRYNTGATYTEHPLFEHFRNREYAEKNQERSFDHIQGGVYIYRRSVFSRIGGFSDTVPQNSTDIEFSYYLESCGEKLGEIPGVRAGTIKTLPDVSAMADEAMFAVHPLSRRNIGKFEKIVQGSTKACNICEWHGGSFGEFGECPDCNSSPFGRSVMHLLSRESIMQHRPRVTVAAEEPALSTYLKRISPDVVEVVPSLIDIDSIADRDLVIIDGTGAEMKSEVHATFVAAAKSKATVIARGVGFVPDILRGEVGLKVFDLSIGSSSFDADWHGIWLTCPREKTLISNDILVECQEQEN